MIDRNKIVESLRAYVERKGSQNKAAATMKGVSGATLTQMLNGNWEKIADKMWRIVASYIGIEDDSWQQADTTIFLNLQEVLRAAQAKSLVVALTAEAGRGKTFSVRWYEEHNKHVYMLRCSEYWSKTDFIDELLRVIGINGDGYRKKDRINLVIRKLKEKQQPLLIFDEFDKLNDAVWHFFITLYNDLEDCCGMVTLSTGYMKLRLERGLRLSKKGYPEIYSRLGSGCSEIGKIDYADITAVCQANGITDQSVIEDIASSSDGDLRLVKRKIIAVKMQLNNN